MKKALIISSVRLGNCMVDTIKYLSINFVLDGLVCEQVRFS
jgi:hypothetical protein